MQRARLSEAAIKRERKKERKSEIKRECVRARKREKESEFVNNSVTLLFMLLPWRVIVNYLNDT